jgi:hypothetical protein
MADEYHGELSPVTVIRDNKLRAAGRRLGDAIVYDWGFELDDRHDEQRSFVLLDDGFQINQPVIFPAVQQGPTSRRRSSTGCCTPASRGTGP